MKLPADQGQKKSFKAALRSQEFACEVGPCAVWTCETNNHNADDDGDLQNGEDELKIAGSLHAEIVQDRNEDGGCDGDELSVGERDGYVDEFAVEKGER